jgi:DNA-3-methyladenine glycosylase II
MTDSVEKRAKKHFKKTDEVMYRLAENAEKKHLWTTRLTEKRGSGRLFETLASSVVSQQLSTKAADTIWNRLRQVCGGKVTPDTILATPLPSLRSAGLSQAKCKTLTELSLAIRNGLNLPALKKIDEEEAIKKLSAVWGIGTWTAEMFLIFALQREDVFSVGDLGLVRAVEEAYGLPKDTPKKIIQEMSLAWAPYRSYACLLLWNFRDTVS